MGEDLPLLEALLAGDRPTAPGAPAPTKAVAWARVSTESQEERGLSLPEQLRQIRSYAAENGYEIVAEYFEAASAFQSEAKRVEFQRMLTTARSDPRIGAILVHDYSRLSRNSLRATSLAGSLRQQGIRVVSVSDPDIDPSSPAGVYVEAILFAKNEAYSREVAFHTTKGCRANIRTRDQETGWCYKNGGPPLWGYRSEHLCRGGRHSSRPIIKSIWLPSETVVAGRPTYEWVRHCLVDLAASGIFLTELRDFCHQTGIPAPRRQYWSTSTWRQLLEPHRLIQYCGYGVWNVKASPRQVRPPSEWEVVPNAHPALISEEEARAIVAARPRAKHLVQGTACSRARPRRLLTGGLFRCGECGANMAGARTDDNRYYVCGSHLYRRGLGCGSALWVREGWLDTRVLAAVQEFIEWCFSDRGAADWERGGPGHPWGEGAACGGPEARELEAAEREIAGLRRSIEEGLVRTAQVNERLRALLGIRAELQARPSGREMAPQFDPQDAKEYVARAREAFSDERRETLPERRELLKPWVDSIVLLPQRREITLTCRMPEAIAGRAIPWRRAELASLQSARTHSSVWAVPPRLTVGSAEPTSPIC